MSFSFVNIDEVAELKSHCILVCDWSFVTWPEVSNGSGGPGKHSLARESTTRVRYGPDQRPGS